MIEEVCKTSDVSPREWEYVKGDRYIVRSLILAYWRKRGWITSEQWFLRSLTEALIDYRRITGEMVSLEVHVGQ